MKYSDGKDYKVVAFVMACIHLEETERMIKQIAKQSEEYNCKVVYYSTHSDFFRSRLYEQMDSAENALFDIIPVEYFDAVIFMAESFKDEELNKKLIDRALMAKVPVICVDKLMEGCINISFDYKNPFREIVKHIVEYHGYREINYMSGNKGVSFSEERLEIFKEVLEENGIPFEPERVYYGNFWEQPTIREMDRMFAEWKRMPEAIVCANDVMAITVCDCLKKKGYLVPEDVAVSGFDGAEIEQYHEPRLLTSGKDRALVTDTIFEIINSGNTEARQIIIPAYRDLKIGSSCGCSKKSVKNGASEVVELKTNMLELMIYQANLGRTIINYGGSGDKKMVEEIIPNHLGVLNYSEFWFVAKHRLLTENYLVNDDSDNEANVIHYVGRGKKADVDYSVGLKEYEIVPDFYKHLESGSPLLVMSIPNVEDEKGYSVIKFDADKFKCISYSGFLVHFRYVLEMIRVRRELIEVYRNDLLTGVYNRSGFYEKMKNVMDNCEVKQITIISIDLYKFKRINDTFGHAEGDKALEFVGKIIKDTVKGYEIPARIGGDEFLIVLYKDEQEKRAEEIISTLNAKAEAYNKKNKKDYEIILSIGTYSDSHKNHSLDHFLKGADERMYAHKSKQREEDR